MLAVAAADQAGEPAAFSLGGPWVGVAAPGVDIIAADPVTGIDGQINQLISDGGRSPIQGTSFSCPYVTGLVALVRSRFPDLSAAQVISRIERTAQHPAAPGGRNDAGGDGMTDPAAALTAVRPGEDGSSPSPRPGPATLPAARAHTDPDRVPRRVALLSSLGLLVVIVAGAVAASTRGRRRAPVTPTSSRRALSRTR